MKKITCTRRIQFCSGHRVLRHEGHCQHLHGHNYVVFFHAEAPNLDSIGRVIDFSVLKDKLGGWVMDNWDHGFIAGEEDIEAQKALGVMSVQKKFILPYNPTAENLAQYLLEVVGPQQLQGTEVTLTKVVMWETENCFATAELES